VSADEFRSFLRKRFGLTWHLGSRSFETRVLGVAAGNGAHVTFGFRAGRGSEAQGGESLEGTENQESSDLCGQGNQSTERTDSRRE